MTTPSLSATVGSHFRKRPVVIHAWQWDETKTMLDFLRSEGMNDVGHTGHRDHPNLCADLRIRTLEDDGKSAHHVSKGDWIIRGVKGEFYACKPDIFAMTYEPASAPSERGLTEQAFEEIELWVGEYGHCRSVKEDAKAMAAFNRIKAAIRRLAAPSATFTPARSTRDHAIEQFIRTIAGPAFGRDDLRAEAKHILNAQGVYAFGEKP